MGEQKRLLVLCCHGVYDKGEFYADRPAEKEVYQDHIRLAFDIMREKTYDVLIISGGYTKLQVEKSEARGYLEWADEIGLDKTGLVILLEEYARSSAENLLFSMCRFYQYFDYFPEKVGACTLHWKKEWFERVIAPALCLPKFAVKTVKNEKEKLTDLMKQFPAGEVKCFDPHDVVNDNCMDPLEIRKDVWKRDRWKKGHPYTDINSAFGKMFGKLDEMKYLYPWKQKV